MTSGAGALWRVVELARPRWWRLSLAVGLGMGAVASTMALLAVSGYLISAAALMPPILTLTVAIVGVRLFSVLRSTLRYGERLASHGEALRVLTDVRTRFFARLVPLVPAGLPGVSRGDLLSRIVGDVDRIQFLFVRGLEPPAVAVGVIIAAGIAAGLMLPLAGVALVLVMAGAALALPLVAVVATRRAARRQAAARAALTDDLVEVIEGAAELVAYGQSAARATRLEHLDAQLVALARRDALVTGLVGGLGTALSGVALVAVLWVAVPAVVEGRLNGVLLAALALLSLAAFEALMPLPAAAQQMEGTIDAARRVDQILDRPPPVADPLSPAPAPVGHHIRLRGVVVDHGHGGSPVLDGVDLDWGVGERLALLGASGAGKTTLAELLVRFIDPIAGSITLDGRPLGDYAQSDLRAVVRLCAQDDHLFGASIAANLRIGDPGAGDGTLRAVLGRVGAGPLLERLPEGLETPVGEAGDLLSGGQRQRLVVARALLGRPRFLIVDEPTAHLDPSSATALMDDLLAADRQMGLLVITHDPGLVDGFDRVLRLADGRLTCHT